jgi:ABC-type transporter Mla subunit MlaD
LALPGVVGRGPDAHIYHLELANVTTLEPNSPVMVADVVVGSVEKMTFTDWHADVEVSVRPDALVPANAVACWAQCTSRSTRQWANRPPVAWPPVPLSA